MYKLICIYKGKVKSAILALFNGPEVLPSAADKPELFSEIDNPILMTSVSFYLFTHLELIRNCTIFP